MLRKDLRREFAGARSTADPAEIARFNALAEEWWKPDGAFKMVHAFNQARVGHIAARLAALCGRDETSQTSLESFVGRIFCDEPASTSPENALAGLKIIDVGCGAGIVAEPLSRLGADVLGIDAAERNVAVAEAHARQSGARVRYRHALASDCVAEFGTFDVVLSLEVVEHVADLDAFLGDLAKLVRPGGLVVIGTLNRTMRSYVKAIIGAEYVLGWLPKGTHDWRKFVVPDELERRFAALGVRKVEASGVVFHPLGNRWSIGRDLSMNYLQILKKDTGAFHPTD